jgi:hypothetical protein
MSHDVQGGINYALVKRHYDCDDFVAIPFTATQDYYVVGAMAYINDNNVVNMERGWTLFAHGQPAPPTFLAPFLAALGLAWPVLVPAFEDKDILFYATQDCYVRFEAGGRVQQLIPANTFMHFRRRCFIFFVQRVTADGTLYVWVEG